MLIPDKYHSLYGVFLTRNDSQALIKSVLLSKQKALGSFLGTLGLKRYTCRLTGI